MDMPEGRRSKKIAKRFLKKAIRCPGLPEKITIDKSGASCSILFAGRLRTLL